MNWICALTLMSTLVVQDSPELWRKYAEKLPLGSAVTVRVTGGERFTALLLAVDETGITVRPKERVQASYRHIPFYQLQQLEPNTGAPYAARVALGTAVGFGIVYGILGLIFASAHWD